MISQYEMVEIQVCQNERIHCPNVLISTAEWQHVIEEWVHTRDIAERLRARVKGEKVLHHHRLHVSISGCPNSCSRPQIADIGLVGFVRPEVAPADCTACGACETACPDIAITTDDGQPVFDRTACHGCMRCHNACPVNCIHLSRPAIRVLLGGKLGRHPRFAEVVGEIFNPTELIALLDRVVGAYLEYAAKGERFADFFLRMRNVHNFLPPK